jgi:hypothetical protein
MLNAHVIANGAVTIQSHHFAALYTHYNASIHLCLDKKPPPKHWWLKD